MSIETRTGQSSDDIAPEGREPDGRQNLPTQSSYDRDVPVETPGDALPLDGSLSLNDTEPQDQSLQSSQQQRVLSGSEAGATANTSIEGDEADSAVEGDGRADAAARANADPSVGRQATGGE